MKTIRVRLHAHASFDPEDSELVSIIISNRRNSDGTYDAYTEEYQRQVLERPGLCAPLFTAGAPPPDAPPPRILTVRVEDDWPEGS